MKVGSGRTRYLTTLTAAGAVALLLAACGSGAGGSGSGSGGKGPITLGEMGPLTGARADIGSAMVQG
ncbi:MAG: branched-chain amino acid ABC transporter substrate-binding protein, partial [Actinobacteria bacterium]|nr:branched-chain amino acid ABC transporter substrate-binding protein [Actinomycetota bacterium]